MRLSKLNGQQLLLSSYGSKFEHVVCLPCVETSHIFRHSLLRLKLMHNDVVLFQMQATCHAHL